MNGHVEPLFDVQILVDLNDDTGVVLFGEVGAGEHQIALCVDLHAVGRADVFGKDLQQLGFIHFIIPLDVCVCKFILCVRSGLIVQALFRP